MTESVIEKWPGRTEYWYYIVRHGQTIVASGITHSESEARERVQKAEDKYIQESLSKGW